MRIRPQRLTVEETVRALANNSPIEGEQPSERFLHDYFVVSRYFVVHGRCVHITPRWDFTPLQKRMLAAIIKLYLEEQHHAVAQ